MLSPASLGAYQALPGTRLCDSVEAGWHSLLLRGYLEPLEAEITTPATPDHLVVLVAGGMCRIESRRNRGWHSANYRPGDLGMTAPGYAAELRWKSGEPHRTLHLHLPTQTVAEAAAELHAGSGAGALPNLLSQTDSVVAGTVLALERAARGGAPELYAESAAQFLAVHLLTRHARAPEPRRYPVRPHALGRADNLMRERMGEAVSLGELAAAAGLSPFQLLRAAKAAWGETPLRRLTRLRMERAKELLGQGDLSVSEIAYRCGYGNPSHFAAAFCRYAGVTPRRYRQG